MRDDRQDSAAIHGGVVREYHADQGWGVIDGPDVPGGCWVHFSAIAANGYRQLEVGGRVAFRAEAAEQDGYDFRAIRVWSGDGEPEPAVHRRDSSDGGAFSSVLTLTFDPPAVDPLPDDPRSNDG